MTDLCVYYAAPIYGCFVVYFLTTFAVAIINLIASFQNKKSASTIYSISFLKFELVLELAVIAVAFLSSFFIGDLMPLIDGFYTTCWYFSDYFGYFAFSMTNGLLILLSIAFNIGTIIVVLVRKFVYHIEGVEKIEDEPTAGYFDATYRTNVYFFVEILESFIFILCNVGVYIVFHFVLAGDYGANWASIWRALGITLALNGLILFFLAVFNTFVLVTRLLKKHFLSQ